jgi:hypothetical protein
MQIGAKPGLYTHQMRWMYMLYMPSTQRFQKELKDSAPHNLPGMYVTFPRNKRPRSGRVTAALVNGAGLSTRRDLCLSVNYLDMCVCVCIHVYIYIYIYIRACIDFHTHNAHVSSLHRRNVVLSISHPQLPRRIGSHT